MCDWSLGANGVFTPAISHRVLIELIRSVPSRPHTELMVITQALVWLSSHPDQGVLKLINDVFATLAASVFTISRQTGYTVGTQKGYSNDELHHGKWDSIVGLQTSYSNAMLCYSRWDPHSAFTFTVLYSLLRLQAHRTNGTTASVASIHCMSYLLISTDYSRLGIAKW